MTHQDINAALEAAFTKVYGDAYKGLAHDWRDFSASEIVSAERVRIIRAMKAHGIETRLIAAIVGLEMNSVYQMLAGRRTSRAMGIVEAVE
jgi:nitrogen regulatory protein PII-like uncharacterized protein